MVFRKRKSNLNTFYATPYKKTFATALRKNPTPPEAKLWERLRLGQIKGNRFVRQKVILGYIADFYSHTSRLVVEVDGQQHENQKAYDKTRDRAFNAAGIYVCRVSAYDVMNHIDGVVEKISRLCTGKGTFTPK